MTSWLSDKAAIVGIGHAPFGRRGEHAERGRLSIVLEAVLKACTDAGVNPSDIDGFTSFATEGVDPSTLAASLGVKSVKYTALSWGGGGGGMVGAYLSAAMAVATGQATCVAVTRSLIQDQQRLGAGFTAEEIARIEKGGPPGYGLQSPGHGFALATRRHMHLYGTTEAAFEEVVTASRLMAMNNPEARFRSPMTSEEYRDSPMLADPLRRVDFCMESDFGVCALVMSTERARDLQQMPAVIKGAAMGSGYRWGGGFFPGTHLSFQEYPGMAIAAQMPEEAFASGGHATVAADVYRAAGMGPSDVDVALIYDHFTPMVLMALEDFGFCPRGDSGGYALDGNLRLGNGPVAVNTHGGNLSEAYTHGMTHVFEAVRQLRGTSPNQVPTETALVVGAAAPTPTGAILLGR
ncbi:MAG: lipid-transfer protein [Ilumatobacteraceae bacterium]|nr:lipid-transfer protein [Ilumatobacteraceae bacterium]